MSKVVGCGRVHSVANLARKDRPRSRNLEQLRHGHHDECIARRLERQSEHVHGRSDVLTFVPPVELLMDHVAEERRLKASLYDSLDYDCDRTNWHSSR